MTVIALLGAGGKMGLRLSANLKRSDYDVRHVEVSEAGRARLASQLGVDCMPLEEALAAADVVILAVPDHMIGPILSGFVASLRVGTAVIMLDAAAPYAGVLPERSDITYFVTHPCHPSIFGNEPTPEALVDFFGGVDATQHIVCALVQGPEDHYALCDAIARTIYHPVGRSHRCSLEQMVVLEPALSETVGATFCLAIRRAAERAAEMGVPRQAAFDFILGHLKVLLAIAFEMFPGARLSDGALKAVSEAEAKIFQEAWIDRVFNRDEIMRSVRSICALK